jgi:hypothetical protein
LNGFDELLLRVIDKTLQYCLGEANADIVYNYLKQTGVQREEIPMKLEEFSIGLRYLMGNSQGQILGFAPILEETILEALCFEMRIRFDKTNSPSFPNQVSELRKVYKRKEIENKTVRISSLERDVSCTELSIEKSGGES